MNKSRPLPVKKSYGVLCARFNLRKKKVEVLMVKKRATFQYIDFVLKSRIRYKFPRDDDKLIYLLNHMTHDEKLDIFTLDFNRIWGRIWLTDPEELKSNPKRYADYLMCKTNFERNFLFDKGKKLKTLILRTQHSETLWEIPKGRKSFPQEKDLVCAIREFEEETNISSQNYEILDDVFFTFTNLSMGVKYINNYYLALYQATAENDRGLNPRLDYANLDQTSEVSDIAWISLDMVPLLNIHPKLVSLLRAVNKILRKKYKIQKMAEIMSSSAISILS